MTRLGVSIAFAALLTDPALAKANRPARIEREPAPVERSGAFDGGWKLSVSTSVGDCPALLPSEISIKGDQIVEAAGIAASAWGYVESDGALVTRFTDGAQAHISRFYGQLRGASGSGAWSSNTDFCGGTWRAMRSRGERAER